MYYWMEAQQNDHGVASDDRGTFTDCKSPLFYIILPANADGPPAILLWMINIKGNIGTYGR